MVPKSGELFGREFGTEIGMIQGDTFYPTIFNIMVGEVVMAVLLEVCGSQEVHNGLGWTSGENTILFYAEDGRISGRNPIWGHTTLRAVVRMFKSVLMQTNIDKNKVIV